MNDNSKTTIDNCIQKAVYVSTGQHSLVKPGNTIRINGEAFLVIAWESGYVTPDELPATITMMLQPITVESLRQDELNSYRRFALNIERMKQDMELSIEHAWEAFKYAPEIVLAESDAS